MAYRCFTNIDPNTNCFYITDVRTRIRFLYETWNIINQDRYTFSTRFKENKSINSKEFLKDTVEPVQLGEFINRIFQNFYATAKASINARLDEEKQSLLANNFKNDDVLNYISKKKQSKINLIEARNNIYRTHNSYDEFINLTKTTCEILNQISAEADIYYKPNTYIRAVIEEYTTLPRAERERIYFKATFDELDSYCKNNRLQAELEFQSFDNNGKLQINEEIKTTSFEPVHVDKNVRVISCRLDQSSPAKPYKVETTIHPYKIVKDNDNNFNYLIGVVLKDESDKDFYSRICSYRISENIFHAIGNGKTFSSLEVQTIERKLVELGPQNLSDRFQIITVKFSEKGLEHFQKWVHLRPNLSSMPVFEYKPEVRKDDANDVINNFIKNNKKKTSKPLVSRIIMEDEKNRIYSFICTEFQAISYFLKFGKDVEILAPIELRDKFIKRYKSAIKNYQK